MTECSAWAALRQLRLGGRKPSLPVIVTTKQVLPRRLEGVGCMVILHEAGTVMPVQLLEGLDVIFFFERCELASSVWRLAQSKNVSFNAKTWCSCADVLSVLPMSCESAIAAKDWAEGPKAKAHAA